LFIFCVIVGVSLIWELGGLWSRESDRAALRVLCWGFELLCLGRWERWELFSLGWFWFSLGIRRCWVGNVDWDVKRLKLGFCWKVNIWAPFLDLGFTVLVI